ncbi:MAG: alpha/beta hydrolase [Candidatus Heimdallarchaeota archaeon]|nr:alpha/beta hydrolase [Candidatus Heimdallarchaeota archaeon]
MSNRGEFEGIRYSYVRSGSGETLILIPGTLGDEKLFEYVEVPDIDLIVFNHLDLRGIEDIIDAYHILFTKMLGLDTFHLGGTSVGGWIAQHYASMHPKRIKTLIIGNTFSNNRILRDRSLRVYNISKFLPWILLRYFFQKSLNKSLLSYNRAIIQYFIQSLDSLGKRNLRNRLAWSLEEITLSIPSVPTSIIYTHDDSVISADITEILIQDYPNAAVYSLEIGDHYPYRTRPDEYSRIIRMIISIED